MIVTDHTLLSSLCEQLKKEGHTIVLASGAFDVLHVGHIRYLNASKSEGTILIVAVNSDASVFSYKGIRTCQPTRERMEIVEAIKGVDIVTSFDEATAHHIVDVVKPDVHSKGTEYSAETLPEYEHITHLGIKVVFVGDQKTHSSGSIKKKFCPQKE